jgi:hypothetical protein
MLNRLAFPRAAVLPSNLSRLGAGLGQKGQRVALGHPLGRETGGSRSKQRCD